MDVDNKVVGVLVVALAMSPVVEEEPPPPTTPTLPSRFAVVELNSELEVRATSVFKDLATLKADNEASTQIGS